MLIPLSLGVEIFTTGTPFGATSNFVLCAEFGSTTKLAANISILYISKNIIVMNFLKNLFLIFSLPSKI